MRRLGVLVVLVGLGCSKGGDERVTALTQAVPLVAPVVSCCDYQDRGKCQDMPTERLDKLIRLGKRDVCFEDGVCFTNCP